MGDDKLDPEVMKGIAEAVKVMTRDMGVGLERELAILAVEKERLELIQDMSGIHKNNLKQQDLVLKTLQKQAEAMAQEEGINENNNKIYKDIVDSLKTSNKSLYKKLEAQGLISDLSAEELADTDKLQQKMLKLAKAAEEVAGRKADAAHFASEARQEVGKLASKMEITADWTKTGAGAMWSFAAAAVTGDWQEKLKGAGFAILDMVSPLNVAGFLLDKMIKNALELDKVAKGFQAATGFAGNFREQLTGVYANTVKSGVSIADAGGALTALANNFHAFDPSAANGHLIENIALLNKVGVSADQSTKIMDHFSRSLGKSAAMSVKLTRELVRSGKSIGISAKDMATGFESAFKSLAIYGDQAIDKFKDLAAQAKATGVSIDSMLKTAKMYDTFSGAAEGAGKLNAVLGTQLSTVEMLNMDYDERINKLRLEINTATGGFNTLDRYTQMYVQQAIGASDVAEAQKLLNMNTAEYAGYKNSMAAQAETQKQLAEYTEKIVPFMQQIQLAFAEMAADPEFLERIAKTMQLLINLVQIAINWWEVLAAVWMTVRIHGLMVAAQTAMIAASKEYETVSLMRSTWAWIMHNIATKAALGWIGAIVIALGVLGALWVATSSPAFYLMPYYIAKGIIIMGRALNTVKGQALLAAVVIALLAGAMALIFYGVAAMIDSFKSFLGFLVESMAFIPLLVVALYGLGTGFFVMSAGLAAGIVLLASVAPLAFIAALGLWTLVPPIFALGVGFKMIGDAMHEVRKAFEVLPKLEGGGFLAVSTNLGGTDMVMASGGILSKVESGKIEVEVNMGEFSMPTPTINIMLDGESLSSHIKKVWVND